MVRRARRRPAARQLARAVVLASTVLLGVLPAHAEPVSEDAYGSWTLRCEDARESRSQACIMFQNLVLRAGGQPVLQFAIGIAPDADTPTVLLSLPLGIALPPGVTMQIDERAPATFPVERCEPDGCRAGMRLRSVTVAQLSAGRQLTITFYDGERQPIRVPLSLDGFDAAFAALRARSAPPQPRARTGVEPE